LVCRICEETIDSNELKEHSQICATRQKLESKALTCDEKFKKLGQSIKKKKKDSLKNLGNYESTLLNILEKFTKNGAAIVYDDEAIDDLNQLITDMKELSEGIDRTQLNSNLLMYLKKIEDLLNQKFHIAQDRLKIPGGFISNSPLKKKSRLKITDFDIIKPISRGAYGRVFLAKKKKTQDIFAIKVLKKEEVYKKKQYDRIMAERNIMAMTANNDFVVKMYYSFQGKEYLYIVMEYLNGGDLFSLLKTFGYFQVDLVRQYTAEILMALEYLHSKKIVHRDLKPDNILIGKDGHIKLTDFGLSEIGLYQNDWLLSDEQNSKMNTDEENEEVFGTPDYLAPVSFLSKLIVKELLLGTEHSFEVDLWAFGVILFELLTGCPPFNDDTPEDIFDNILSLDIPWPEEGLLPSDAIDLIENLLVIDPKERYSIEQIKTHPFYRNVNWKNLFNEKSLYLPKLPEDDTSSFDIRQENYPVVDDEKLQISHDVIPSAATSPVGSFNFCGVDNLVEMNKIQIKKLQFEDFENK
jgi:serine/threonine protein kinase